MKAQSVTIDIIVGLFVLAGLASMAVLAVQVSGGSKFGGSGDSYELHTWFDNIGQLKSGAPVRVSGVTVGYVDAISMDSERYAAKVDLRIGNNYQFPFDTSASIYTSGLLGEQYIGLEPGGEIDFLQDGDIIEFTSSALVLEDLIGKFLFSKSTE